MKNKIVFVICLSAVLFSFTGLFAQNDITTIPKEHSTYMWFEENKKTAIDTYVYSILPGGGLFYAEEPGIALGFATVETGLLIYTALKANIANPFLGMNENNPDLALYECYFGLSLYLAVKLTDIIVSLICVDGYNKKLMEKITLNKDTAILFNGNGLSISSRF